MTYREIIKMSVRTLRINKIRTLLTVLGVIIGISSVMIIVSAGDSMKKLVNGQLESFGSSLIQTETRVPEQSGGVSSQASGVVITSMTLDDREAVNRLPNIARSYGHVMAQDLLSWEGNIKKTIIFGVSPEYIEMGSAKVAEGRFYTKEEDDNMARVIVLGSKVKEQIFGNSSALGQNIKINKMNYKVVGVMESQGTMLFFDYDTLAYVPLQTTQKLLLGINYIQSISAEMIDITKGEDTKAEITSLLRERHDIDDPKRDDFEVSTMADAMDILNTIIGGVTLLLIALAMVSLIVGGVGIMNIMYATVAERTFEIGLRKAVGSTKKNILRQFLTEAVIVTIIGGIGGVIVGVIVTYLIYIIANSYGFAWPFSISYIGILISLVFATLVGLIFGSYPAKKAAELDPITALRRE
ncbi:MAG: ABC transporter permease [Patescibacteria group bacterium]|jgi:putative ABC transport system permease protein